jgi:hypothetical protein
MFSQDSPYKHVMIPHVTDKDEDVKIINTIEMLEYLQKYWPRIWRDYSSHFFTAGDISPSMVSKTLLEIASIFKVHILFPITAGVAGTQWLPLMKKLEEIRKHIVFESIEAGI